MGSGPSKLELQDDIARREAALLSLAAELDAERVEKAEITAKLSMLNGELTKEIKMVSRETALQYEELRLDYATLKRQADAAKVGVPARYGATGGSWNPGTGSLNATGSTSAYATADAASIAEAARSNLHGENDSDSEPEAEPDQAAMRIAEAKEIYLDATEMYRAGDPGEASVQYDAARAAGYPWPDKCHNRQALCQSKLGNDDECLRAHDRSIEAAPSESMYWFARGCKLKSLGRLEEAESDLQHALMLRPVDDDFKQELKSVQKLLGVGEHDAEPRAANSVPGFWDSRFAELETFKRENGHVDVPDSHTKTPALAIWVQMQRREWAKGQLHPDPKQHESRLNRLYQLGFNFGAPPPLTITASTFGETHASLPETLERMSPRLDSPRKPGGSKSPSKSPTGLAPDAAEAAAADAPGEKADDAEAAVAPAAAAASPEKSPRKKKVVKKKGAKEGAKASAKAKAGPKAGAKAAVGGAAAKKKAAPKKKAAAAAPKKKAAAKGGAKKVGKKKAAAKAKA